MKRLLLILLVLGLVLAGCADDADDAAADAAADTEFVDGTYTAAYDYADSRGWRAFLQINVDGGVITDVDFDYVNADGTRKSEDEGYNQRWQGALEEDIDMNIARDTFAEQLIDRQSVPIDVVSGATGSSELMNELGDAALERAREGNTELAIVPYDLTVTAEDEEDERGWTARVELSFEDGELVAVDYDEVEYDDDGEIVNRKSEDEAYAERWEGADGISQMEAFPELEQRLLDAGGNPDEVDQVTGATGSWARFVDVVQRALDNRESPDLPVTVN